MKLVKSLIRKAVNSLLNGEIGNRLALRYIPERDELISSLLRSGILHHYPQQISGNEGVSEAPKSEPRDEELVQRIIISYAKASRNPLEQQGSFWSDYTSNYNKENHRILLEGDPRVVTDMLRNPAASMLFYGFENITSADKPRTGEAWWRHWLHLLCYDNLLRLAEIVGIVRMQYPEAPKSDLESAHPPAVEELLLALDNAFGFRIDFPNLFPEEIGLATSRGVASYRAVQALYQAYRVITLLDTNRDAHVLEIGAGLGRTAYYCEKFGISKYTIVDLPLTNVAQEYFLGRTLGENAVRFVGESCNNASDIPQIRIIPPDYFFSSSENYDLVINVDSLTEMTKPIASNYFDHIRQHSLCFLSINHEHNSFTCRDIYLNHQASRISRTSYPMRRGYVEEIIEFA